MKLIPRYLAALVVVLMLLGNTYTAFSQTEDEPISGDWSQPVNASRSGGATQPAMVVDAKGIIHVFWFDQTTGFNYVSGSNSEWSIPTTPRFPFQPTKRDNTGKLQAATPVFIDTPNGFVHALWRDEKNALSYSGAISQSVGVGSGWIEAKKLFASFLSFDVTSDPAGNLYLLVAKGAESDTAIPGIYFVKYMASGSYWTSPLLLSESTYLRSADPQRSSVSIAVRETNGTQQVFAAWDIRARSKVYFAKSDNGGTNWTEPLVIDGPEMNAAPVTPENIRVGANQTDVVLLWQSSQPGSSCIQYYQVSKDSGQNWEERRLLGDDSLQGCPDVNQFMVAADNTLLLFVRLLNQGYLQAWNGSQWSSLQSQSNFSVFTDPETFNVVNLGGQEVTIKADQLYAVGVDTGIGGDVWFSTKALGPVSSWFTSGSGWSNPITVASGSNIEFAQNLVTDVNGSLHLFWNQTADPSLNTASTIFYSRWDGQSWANPLALFPSALRSAGVPDGIVASDNRIHLIVSDKASGELFYTSAPSTQADLLDQWRVPKKIEGIANVGDEPVLRVSPNGSLYVLYTVPINENRGLFLLESEDGGLSWNSPVKIFDAAAAGWEMIDQPHLLITGENRFHILMTQYRTASGTDAAGLFYLHSDDGGETWSEPVRAFEGNFKSAQLEASSDQAIHIIQEYDTNSGSTFQYSFSNDGGYTWDFGGGFTSQAAQAGNSAVGLLDGNIHVFQINNANSRSVRLQSWRWNNGQWESAENHDLASGLVMEPHGLQVGVTGNQIYAVYALGSSDGQETNQEKIFSISQDLSSSQGASSEQGVETLVPIATPTSEPTVEATATVNPGGLISTNANRGIDISNLPTTGLRTISKWVGLVIGVGMSFFIIVAMVIWRNNRKHTRRRYKS